MKYFLNITLQLLEVDALLLRKKGMYVLGIIILIYIS